MEYKLSKAIFSKEAILKVAYLWQENCLLRIHEDENNWILSTDIEKSDTSFDFEKFKKDLLEQQLKEALNLQFGTLRECIYRKAFQHFSD